jgi:hypothetical protein
MKHGEAEHECEPPIDGAIQHRWRCKTCGKIWEVIGFDDSGKSIYEERTR